MSVQRSIVQKLYESKGLYESSFESGGSTYKCAFGKYYKDGEEITRDEYFGAQPNSKGNENSNDSQESPTSPHDSFKEELSKLANANSKPYKDGHVTTFSAGPELDNFVKNIPDTYKKIKSKGTDERGTTIYSDTSGNTIWVNKDGDKSKIWCYNEPKHAHSSDVKKSDNSSFSAIKDIFSFSTETLDLESMEKDEDSDEYMHSFVDHMKKHLGEEAKNIAVIDTETSDTDDLDDLLDELDPISSGYDEDANADYELYDVGGNRVIRTTIEGVTYYGKKKDTSPKRRPEKKTSRGSTETTIEIPEDEPLNIEEIQSHYKIVRNAERKKIPVGPKQEAFHTYYHTLYNLVDSLKTAKSQITDSVMKQHTLSEWRKLVEEFNKSVEEPERKYRAGEITMKEYFATRRKLDPTGTMEWMKPVIDYLDIVNEYKKKYLDLLDSEDKNS